MTRKHIRQLNRMAKRSKHGMSKAKVFAKSTNNLQVVKEK